MQYYTKQQLQGAGRYTGRCRIGNWNEDAELDEIILKDYMAKKERGELKLDKFQHRMAVAHTPVELSQVADDSCVHFGDVFCLRNVQTGAVLAADVEDRDPRPGEGFACAVSATTLPTSSQPCARNTWLITRYKCPPKSSTFERHYADGVLHYGQKFRLVANPQIVGLDLEDMETPLYLRSMPVSTQHYAKHSRKQEVSLSPARHYNSVWMAVCLNPAERLVNEGKPVPAGSPFVLVHCATNEALCCQGHVHMNDFGKELEVCCHNASPAKMVGALERTTKGLPEQLTAKGETRSNHWVLEVGTALRQPHFRAPCESVVGPALERVRSGLQEAREDGYVKLLRALEALDKAASGWLERAEFVRVLKSQTGVQLTQDEVVALGHFFDWEGVSSVNYRETLQFALQSSE